MVMDVTSCYRGDDPCLEHLTWNVLKVQAEVFRGRFVTVLQQTEAFFTCGMCVEGSRTQMDKTKTPTIICFHGNTTNACICISVNPWLIFLHIRCVLVIGVFKSSNTGVCISRVSCLMLGFFLLFIFIYFSLNFLNLRQCSLFFFSCFVICFSINSCSQNLKDQ